MAKRFGRRKKSDKRLDYWAKTILDAGEIYPEKIDAADENRVVITFSADSLPGDDIVSRIESAFLDVDQAVLVEDEDVKPVKGKPLIISVKLLGF